MTLRELQEIVRERNLVIASALKCAALVLEQARDLPPDRQSDMVELVKALIFTGEKTVNPCLDSEPLWLFRNSIKHRLQFLESSVILDNEYHN